MTCATKVMSVDAHSTKASHLRRFPGQGAFFRCSFAAG